MMKKLMFILFFPMMTSCIIETTSPSEAYYHFRDDDYNKLIEITQNDTIKYINQFNDTISYTVNELTTDYKTQLTQGSWVLPGTANFFYYDRKIIELLSSNYENYKIEYLFNRFPNDVEQAKEDYFTEYDSSFNVGVDFYLWNGIGDYGTINIDYNYNTVTMLVNGINYENVIVIDSNNPEPLIYSTTPERNVNRIYYDIGFGIIGFDDLNNIQWRILN